MIVQAGASEAGRQLAAETAEVIFGSSRSMEDGQRFYADVKGRLKALGRLPDSLKILPGALVVVGRTQAEAREKIALLDSLVHPDSGVPNLSMRLGVDASGFDLDGPLPEIPPSNASQSGRDTLVALARRDNLTVRQLAQICGGYGGLQFVGTPGEIADKMQAWLEGEACDGFNVMFHTSAGGARRFRGPRCPGTAAARDLPPRIRGHDAAGSPRAGAAGEPVLPGAGPRPQSRRQAVLF